MSFFCHCLDKSTTNDKAEIMSEKYENSLKSSQKNGGYNDNEKSRLEVSKRNKNENSLLYEKHLLKQLKDKEKALEKQHLSNTITKNQLNYLLKKLKDNNNGNDYLQTNYYDNTNFNNEDYLEMTEFILQHRDIDAKSVNSNMSMNTFRFNKANINVNSNSKREKNAHGNNNNLNITKIKDESTNIKEIREAVTNNMKSNPVKLYTSEINETNMTNLIDKTKIKAIKKVKKMDSIKTPVETDNFTFNIEVEDIQDIKKIEQNQKVKINDSQKKRIANNNDISIKIENNNIKPDNYNSELASKKKKEILRENEEVIFQNLMKSKKDKGIEANNINDENKREKTFKKNIAKKDNNKTKDIKICNKNHNNKKKIEVNNKNKPLKENMISKNEINNQIKEYSLDSESDENEKNNDNSNNQSNSKESENNSGSSDRNSKKYKVKHKKCKPRSNIINKLNIKMKQGSIKPKEASKIEFKNHKKIENDNDSKNKINTNYKYLNAENSNNQFSNINYKLTSCANCDNNFNYSNQYKNCQSCMIENNENSLKFNLLNNNSMNNFITNNPYLTQLNYLNQLTQINQLNQISNLQNITGMNTIKNISSLSNLSNFNNINNLNSLLSPYSNTCSFTTRQSLANLVNNIISPMNNINNNINSNNIKNINNINSYFNIECKENGLIAYFNYEIVLNAIKSNVIQVISKSAGCEKCRQIYSFIVLNKLGEVKLFTCNYCGHNINPQSIVYYIDKLVKRISC